MILSINIPEHWQDLKSQQVPKPGDNINTFIRFHLFEILNMNDLANYLVLSALMSKSREQLLKNVLKTTNFSVITQDYHEAAMIIEHFLNGNNKDFQKCLNSIQRQMKFDPFFGDHYLDQTKFQNEDLPVSVFEEQRQRALTQHIRAYKVISMNEIAEEFQMSVQQTEYDLCKLISTGKIHFKINTKDKTLHRKVVN